MNISRIKGNKLLRWANKSTKGNVEFFYASFYDGKNQLELKPVPLRCKRLNFFSSSITNPLVFNNFFNLALSSRQIAYSDFIINSLFSEPIILDDSAKYEMIVNNHCIEGAPKDLDFSLNDIFFKIDRIGYEKAS